VKNKNIQSPFEKLVYNLYRLTCMIFQAKV